MGVSLTLEWWDWQCYILSYLDLIFLLPKQTLQKEYIMRTWFIACAQWGAWVPDVVSALPFTTKLQVKPGRMGSVAGWVTICADSQTWDSCE